MDFGEAQRACKPLLRCKENASSSFSALSADKVQRCPGREVGLKFDHFIPEGEGGVWHHRVWCRPCTTVMLDPLVRET